MEAISSTIQTNAVTPALSSGAVQISKPQVESTNKPSEQPVSEKDVQQAINEITSSIGQTNESIGFSYEKKLGQLFVLVTDSASGEVIREVPSKDFIKHQLAMQEIIGLLLDKQA
jgi:flagellar protein FlaG